VSRFDLGRGIDHVSLLKNSGPFDALLKRSDPLLALAPMQDITDLPFWRLLSRYGGPDVYYTEYFRVHPTSHLDRQILRSVTENPTGRPVIAQMIGNDISSLVRTVERLQEYPVAGIDLNLGCPAPVVYRKCAGGGLLREPRRVDAILQALRGAITSAAFTVKTRLGFESDSLFDEFLGIFRHHAPDLMAVHGRTVKEMYGPVVHYGQIARAVQNLPFPVLANGNVDSPETASAVLAQTGARGLMIGRGAIRNPWIFEQIRQHRAGLPVFRPRGADLLEYIRELYEEVKPPELRIEAHVQKMKKYMNYIGVGIDPDGQFLHQIRRAESETAFFQICEQFLDHAGPAFPLSSEGSAFARGADWRDQGSNWFSAPGAERTPSRTPSKL
jgi:tRNA-dihydrouridine synthase B